jgi:two-component system, cell cycle response regulator
MNVLVADDDVVSRRLLEVSLSQAGYQVEMAANGAEALRALQEPDRHRLAVLDWMMPEMDGVDVCRAVRKVAREPYIYIILLTAKERQNDIVEGLEAGADDYITKPFDLHELRARLRSGKRVIELQQQLVSARDELRERATRDFLTGLWNREAILETFKNEMVRSVREGSKLSIVLADLDYFKRVSDTHGHVVGDAVLREVGRRMRESVRVYDLVGRYGGEEFLIVSPGCGLSEAVDQAERIRRVVAAEAIAVPGASLVATMSLGVATTAPQDTDEEGLLRAADEALYAAKKNGRNRVGIGLQTQAGTQPVSPVAAVLLREKS